MGARKTRDELAVELAEKYPNGATMWRMNGDKREERHFDKEDLITQVLHGRDSWKWHLPEAEGQTITKKPSPAKVNPENGGEAPKKPTRRRTPAKPKGE